MEFCRCRYGLRFFHPSRVPAKRARSEWIVGNPSVTGLRKGCPTPNRNRALSSPNRIRESQVFTSGFRNLRRTDPRPPPRTKAFKVFRSERGSVLQLQGQARETVVGVP